MQGVRINVSCPFDLLLFNLFSHDKKINLGVLCLFCFLLKYLLPIIRCIQILCERVYRACLYFYTILYRRENLIFLSRACFFFFFVCVWWKRFYSWKMFILQPVRKKSTRIDIGTSYFEIRGPLFRGRHLGVCVVNVVILYMKTMMNRRI